jgi:uncharacterized membrane protein YkgB
LLLRCSTFRLKEDTEANVDGTRFESYEFGLFSIRKFEYIGSTDEGQLVFANTCVEYPPEIERDRLWKTAGILQVVSWVIGAILVIALFASQCGAKFSPNAFGLIGLCFVFVCSLFDVLSFLVFDSVLCKNNPVLDLLEVGEFYQDNCDLGPGSGALFISIIGYFATGLICCCLGGSNPDDDLEEDFSFVVGELDKEEPEAAIQGATEEEAATPAETAEDEAVPVVEDDYFGQEIAANESVEMTENEFSTSIALATEETTF